MGTENYSALLTFQTQYSNDHILESKDWEKLKKEKLKL